MPIDKKTIAKPSRKIVSAGIGGAVTAMVILGVNKFAPGYAFSADEAAIIAAAMPVIFGYFTKERT